jgi:hypothetical protein
MMNAQIKAISGARALVAATLIIVPASFAGEGPLGSGRGPTVMPAAVGASGQPARLLSAFFGLDNGLPFGANLICLGASGQDGMPVVLSHTINPTTLQPEDFQIVTRSGAVRTPYCVTLRPAQDPGELRTVLLIGEFGDAANDPPVGVRVVDDLLSDGNHLREGDAVNFRGTQTDVTPLDVGPSMVLAEVVPESEWLIKTRGTACPAGIQQVVRVTWDGGVRLPNRDELSDVERGLYRVTVERGGRASDEIVPAALADLEDRDNNHLLCLDTSDPAVSVSFPAGHLVDPNGDLNPDTHIAVNGVVK